MAEFSYLFADLFTNQVSIEVPVFGVSYDRALNAAGNCTLSIALDNSEYSNQDIIDATVPGKTAVYMDRDGQLFWGGILWSRTYQAQAKVLQFTGQSFESYLYKIVIETSLTFTNKDQRSIVCELLNYAQSKLNCDIGIQLDPNYPFSGGTLRTVSFYDYDLWTVGKALDYMAQYDQGLDWTINVFYGDDGAPTKRLLTDNRLGADSDTTQLSWEYPTNVANYYWPENASRAAVSVVGAGAGDGVAKIRYVSRNSALLAEGYPDLQEVYTNDDVSVMSTLVTQTTQHQTLLNPPISVPTIQIKPDEDPQLGTWALGDYAHFRAEDPRFEGGLDKLVRVVGYSGNPSTSEGSESCSLVLDGQDSAT